MGFRPDAGYSACIRRTFVVREAREAGLQLAIASTTTPANVHALLSAALAPESTRWFSVIASGDVVPRKKPEPDIYVNVLQRMRLPRSVSDLGRTNS